MTNALLNTLVMGGFLVCAALAFVSFLAWRHAVLHGRIGPLAASLGYASCVAAMPPAVWLVERACLMSFRSTNQSFWAHVGDIAQGFTLLAALWTSWGVGALVACLAAWRFIVISRRFGAAPA